MKNSKRSLQLAIVFGMGVIMQLGGCFGSLTTTSTISGRDFFVNGLRGLVLGPLDNIIVQTVDRLFAEEQ